MTIFAIVEFCQLERMKFKRLEIKNIASIKHAVVDFDKDPIKSARLFLINGPTGSGKSVIFDSICLALFRTAPRLENLGNRLVEDSMSDEGTMRLSSPISFVRRGVSDASVTLTFEGNNGHIYEARWETELYVKGEKKGTLKGEKQYVTDLTDNAEFRSAKELKDLIKSNDVVGLDFDRFTRTTMLAQGAFTRFLSADEKEKSDILRKIVGLDYFCMIGKKISEIYSEKKRQLDAQKAGLNSITFMDDETLEQTKRELIQTEESLLKVKKEHGRLKQFIDYKERMKRLEDEVSHLREAWISALEQVTSDRYFELVTLDGYLSRIAPLGEVVAKLTDAEKTKVSLDIDLRALARKRMAVVKGLTALSTRISAEKDQLSAIEKELKSFDEYSEILDNLPVLKENIKQYDSLVKKSHEIGSEIQSLQKESLAVDKPINDLSVEIESVEIEFKKAVEVEKTLKETFDQEEFNRLTSTGNDLTSRLKSLNTALEPSRKIDDISSRIATQKKEIAEQETVLEKLKKDIERATTKSVETQRQLSEFKERYDRARRSISDTATELRHGLKTGDNCPVCGSKIQADLLDDAFREALKPLDEHLSTLNDADKEATSRLNDLRIAFDTTNSLLKKTIIELKSSVEEFESVKGKLHKLLIDIGLTDDMPNLTAELTDRISATEFLITENNRKLKNWGEIQNKVANASELVAKLTSKLNDLKQKKSEKLTHKEAVKAKLDSKTKEQETLKTESDTLKERISAGLSSKLKELTFDKLVDELDSKFEKRESLNNQLIQLNDSIKLAETMRDDIEKSLSDIKLDDVEMDVPVIDDSDLRGEVSRLTTDVAVNRSRLQDVSKEIDGLKTQEQEFYLLNPDLTAEFCRGLLAVKSEVVDNIRQECLSIRNLASETYKQFATAIQMVLSQRDNEIESSVEIQVEEATDLVAQLAGENDNLSATVGALKQRLATDDENKKRFATQREEIEKLEGEVALWSEVNADFGGQNGERFSRVASAYALNNLIERANFYLSKFSPRYILSPNAGSLEISIYDNLSGYTRAFNTLSGGESFVMSLSLALALSAIQDARTVPDTIFIDEGFGTLSADYLDRVMTTLEQLQLIEGRRVALISHVDILRERIPVKITVTPNGNSSTVKVVSD